MLLFRVIIQLKTNFELIFLSVKLFNQSHQQSIQLIHRSIPLINPGHHFFEGKPTYPRQPTFSDVAMPHTHERFPSNTTTKISTRLCSKNSITPSAPAQNPRAPQPDPARKNISGLCLKFFWRPLNPCTKYAS